MRYVLCIVPDVQKVSNKPEFMGLAFWFLAPQKVVVAKPASFGFPQVFKQRSWGGPGDKVMSSPRLIPLWKDFKYLINDMYKSKVKYM